MLGPPIMLLNVFGGIVSGIWLAILGQWGSIGVGILIIAVGGFGIRLFERTASSPAGLS